LKIEKNPSKKNFGPKKIHPKNFSLKKIRPKKLKDEEKKSRNNFAHFFILTAPTKDY